MAVQLLVRNRVRDFPTWLAVFEADMKRGAAFGITVAALWQAVDEPNNVFFLLDVESVDRANAFMADPESEAVGERAGVVDGEFHYLNPVS